MDTELVGDRRKGKVAYYITPQIEHWPRYNAARKRFEYKRECTTAAYLRMASMLDLTQAEAEALQVAKMFMDYKVVRAGRAPVSKIRERFCCARGMGQ